MSTTHKGARPCGVVLQQAPRLHQRSSDAGRPARRRVGLHHKRRPASPAARRPPLRTAELAVKRVMGAQRTPGPGRTAPGNEQQARVYFPTKQLTFWSYARVLPFPQHAPLAAGRSNRSANTSLFTRRARAAELAGAAPSGATSRRKSKPLDAPRARSRQSRRPLPPSLGAVYGGAGG